ncbi:hypothetical protein BAE44_0002248 [Dichanthelium oligosanthes]|uniref:Tify domain-containing protein n=1 Tax=Dichanthelium oligosanthes TaxID=888268 RepID=A0A1E5WH57_9POAL|nr:hypothetical protein BAE44_0002248 [Dichanthelium oligosanthes]
MSSSSSSEEKPEQCNPAASVALNSVRDLLPLLFDFAVTYRFKEVSTLTTKIRPGSSPSTRFGSDEAPSPALRRRRLASPALVYNFSASARRPGLRDSSPTVATPAPAPPTPSAATAARSASSITCPSVRRFCGFALKIEGFFSGAAQVLSALQFEKHAGSESKNQNGHIFLSNGKSLYALFQALRDVPAEAFAEKFEAAVGVPMTIAAAEAPPAPQGPRQGHQPGAPASCEPNGVQADGVMSEPPSAPAPARVDVEMLTDEEKASLCLLGLRESSCTSQSDPMYGVEGPAAEESEDAAGSDHAMPDVKEIRNGAGEHRPRYGSLSTITPVKVRVTETKYQLDSYLKDVRGLLSTGLLEGFKVTYKKDEVEKIGRISGQGYSCGCSECNYCSNVMNACEFEQHSGQSSNNQNDHIFLETGISLFKVVKSLKHYRLNMLGEFIEQTIGFPPNMDEYKKWKASFQKRKDYSDAVASGCCSTQSSRESAVGEMIDSLKDHLKESASNSIPNINWSASKRRSERHSKRGGTETSTPALSGSQDKGVSGLSTGTSKKNSTEETHSENSAGPLSIDGVKPDSPEPTAIIPYYSKHDPTNLELSLSSPVTIAQEPLPNCNIDSKSKESKTRDTTLHPLIFKEGGLPDNTLLTYKLKNGEDLKQGYKRGAGIVCNCCNQEFTPSHFEEHAGMGRRRQPYRNIYTSEGVTLHKLALQLQDRLNSNGFGNANVSSFSDYPNLTSSGNLMGVVYAEVHYNSLFSFLCERPCHIRCHNNELEKKKVPLEILKEYTRFRFLCCEKCRLLRAHLDEGLEKCEEIAFLRRIRSNISWRLLSGMNASSDVQLYMPQVIDILKNAFAETAEHSGVFSDMQGYRWREGFSRNVLCSVNCKGYFVLLLKTIEAHLRAWDVKLLTAPVDPEMAPIWSEKLGFTILSDEERYRSIVVVLFPEEVDAGVATLGDV